MNKKITNEMEQIAKYRLHAEIRRARSPLRIDSNVPTPGVTVVDGVVSIKAAPRAAAVSLLGSATKTFGRSKISIPEYKTARIKKI